MNYNVLITAIQQSDSVRYNIYIYIYIYIYTYTYTYAHILFHILFHEAMKLKDAYSLEGKL